MLGSALKPLALILFIIASSTARTSGLVGVMGTVAAVPNVCVSDAFGVDDVFGVDDAFALLFAGLLQPVTKQDSIRIAMIPAEYFFCMAFMYVSSFPHIHLSMY
jgi:hypothetical protein